MPVVNKSVIPEVPEERIVFSGGPGSADTLLLVGAAFSEPGDSALAFPPPSHRPWRANLMFLRKLMFSCIFFTVVKWIPFGRYYMLGSTVDEIGASGSASARGSPSWDE